MVERHFPTEADLVSRCRAVTKPGTYAILPQASRVESYLPNFRDVDVYVLAAPQLGARFVECELFVKPGGGSNQPIDDGLEQFLFVLEGEIILELDAQSHHLTKGGLSWLPPHLSYNIYNSSKELSRVLWLRKRYEPIEGLKIPELIITHEKDILAYPWKASNLEKNLIPFHENLAFDMGCILLFFDPGHYFDFAESHINEHGLYMYEGRGVYWLNGNYHEAQAGDFIYMAPYCPQFFYPTGWDRSSYILYKEVNRDYINGL